jgi:hypothetical protein
MIFLRKDRMRIVRVLCNTSEREIPAPRTFSQLNGLVPHRKSFVANELKATFEYSR